MEQEQAKVCGGCQQLKSLSDFYARKQASDGRQARCKDCQSQYQKTNWRRHKDTRNADKRALRMSPEFRARERPVINDWKRRNRRKINCYKHHISEQDYLVKLEAQAGCCAVCKRQAKLDIDHDHQCCSGPTSCGKCVRGLLCPPCNKGLGNFCDDPQRLVAALQYLQQYN